MSLPAAATDPRARARISNGSLLPGVDGRSAAARRFRDLVAEFGRELGQGEPLSVRALSSAEVALVRQAAAITVRAEALQADIVSGAAIDDSNVVRLTNAACRILLAITRARKGKPKNALPSIAEHFAKKRAAL